jgi:regulator of ribonuclease activity A
MKTTDLCDDHEARVRAAAPIFRDYGGRAEMAGPATTLVVHEDNALVRAALEEPGRGRVLVVDGGGSLRAALVGGNLAALAQKNGWAGVVVHGCVRDTDELAAADVAIKALAAHPKKSQKTGAGERDVTVSFAGVSIAPGEWVYGDRDGLIVAATSLAPS